MLPRSPRSPSGRILAGAAVLIATATSCAQAAHEEAPESPAAVQVQEGERLSINGTELFVRRLGTGEPVIVVHGGPLLDHGYLLPWLEPLADEFEFVFYDQRLSGRSAGNVDPASIRLTTFVRDIEALRTELGLGDVHVLAHSWGGLLAMRYAIDHQDLLRSLTLISPIPASSSDWQREQQAQPPAGEELRDAMASLRQSPAFQAREPAAVREMLLLSFRPQFVTPESADRLQLHVPADYGARSSALSAMMSDLQEFDLYEDLRSVGTRTLLVYGDQEAGAAIGGAAVTTAMPGAELHVMPRAGHFAFIEQPQAFVELVRTFLRQPD